MARPRRSSNQTVREIAIGYRSTLPAGPQRVPVIVVLNGPQIGLRRKLEGGAFEVGRDPTADLSIRDPDVAWRHLRITRDGEAWAVTDLGSQNGTALNGRMVQSAPLTPDDRIRIGGTVLRFELRNPVEQAFDAAVEERLWRDDLTGLMSRRKLELELGARLESAKVVESTIGVIALDLDHLKSINDRWGHLVGAQMIAAAGRAIGGAIPKGAFAARLGGDEFAVAVPGADLDETEGLAIRICAAVASMVVEHEGERLRVGVTAGIAVGPQQGADPSVLMRAADDALYRAKRQTRGGVHR